MCVVATSVKIENVSSLQIHFSAWSSSHRAEEIQSERHTLTLKQTDWKENKTKYVQNSDLKKLLMHLKASDCLRSCHTQTHLTVMYSRLHISIHDVVKQRKWKQSCRTTMYESTLEGKVSKIRAYEVAAVSLKQCVIQYVKKSKDDQKIVMSIMSNSAYLFFT